MSPTNYPTSLDDGTSLPTKADGDVIASSETNTQSGAIKALEAKVGIDGSAATTSHDYKIAALEAGDAAVHIADTSAAHAASAVSVNSATLVGTGTDVQAVFEEVDNAIVAAEGVSSAHLADTSTAHAAASVDAVAVGGGGTETIKAVGSTGSTETIALTLTDGNVQTFTVDANCTFTMPSSLGAGAKSFTAILTDSGGPRTITFTGVLWSGGTDPTVMSGASKIDIFTFLTIDGGTTWYGFTGGTAMAT